MTYTAHEETHRGIEIEIIQDDDAYHMNPLENDEGMPPMAIGNGDGRGLNTIYRDPFDCMTNVQAMQNWEAICEAMDLCKDTFQDQIRETALNDGWPFPNPDHFHAGLYEEFATLGLHDFEDLRPDDMDTVATLFRIAGVPAATFSKCGYSKGDYLKIMVVHLPEWRERVGAPSYDVTSVDPEENGQKDMAASAQHYADWAFGDVYGFKVTDPTTGAEDSCWGFIGSYMSESWDYMLSEARDAADQLADDRDEAEALAIISERGDLYQLAA